MRTRQLVNIRSENIAKYGKPPSWQQVQSFLDELGVGKFNFERFYGLPYNTLGKYKAGTQELAATFWHLFYERIKIPFGCGFTEAYDKLYSVEGHPKEKPKIYKRKAKKATIEMLQRHDRLNKII